MDNGCLPRSPCEAAIVHNHWIHYQDLLFRELARRGLELTVLYTARGSVHGVEPPLPVGCDYQSWVGHDGPYETASQAAAGWRVWRKLDRLRPRRLMIAGWFDAAAWSAWLWGRVHRRPMVLWAESNAFDHRRRPIPEAVKRVYAGGFRAVHVYGRTNREYMVDLGVAEERVFTGRAVVNTALFRPAGVEKPAHRVLIFVGRFAPEKNLPLLLKALARLRQDAAHPRLRLKLVGYGPQEAELRETAAALGLMPFVEFHGRARQADLPALYSAADGLVLPSASEPWGLVVNEAMCCGLAAIVSDRCGCAADLVTAETGWIFPFDDEARLAAILEEFAGSSRGRLAVMGARARAVSARYSPEAAADSVMACLRTIE